MTRWLQQFFASEAAGGVVMLMAAASAMLIANSPLHGAYQQWLHLPIGPFDLHHAINDVLMPLFFLLVGMELKHEMLHGALAEPRQRVLPLIAALGGIAVPALIYLALTDSTLAHGWAIPTATDIAFAICIVTLAGNRVPPAAKIFLLAIAIYDDLAAILIIALFYTATIAILPLVLSVATLAAMVLLNRSRFDSAWLILSLGVLLAILLYKAGIHTTVAGMATGLCLPNRRLEPLMQRLHPFISFGVLPIFAFASAGIDLAGLTFQSLAEPLPLGIALGLLIGKPLGIFAATMLAIRLGYATAPASARMLFAISVTAGIGFTMSLFIGQLAFSDASLHNALKLGVLTGSVLSAVIGLIALRRAH